MSGGSWRGGENREDGGSIESTSRNDFFWNTLRPCTAGHLRMRAHPERVFLSYPIVYLPRTTALVDNMLQMFGEPGCIVQRTGRGSKTTVTDQLCRLRRWNSQRSLSEKGCFWCYGSDRCLGYNRTRLVRIVASEQLKEIK